MSVIAAGYTPVRSRSELASVHSCFRIVGASAFRACRPVAVNLGIAIAAKMPIMTTTIISSIRVKPLLFRSFFMRMLQVSGIGIFDAHRRRFKLKFSKGCAE
jgi:hypothetical protein